MPPPNFNIIRGSAIDGRAHNPFFRKDQLKKLHYVLSESAIKIQESIVQDHAYTDAEVKVEFWLTMRCLVDAYTSLDPTTEFELERAISNVENAPDRRQPIGVIILEPARHTFLYSLTCGLAAAISSGNCVIVETERTLLQSTQLVLSLVQHALGDDTFTVSYRPVTGVELRCRHAHIAQESSERPRVITIVERDANIQEAAKALVYARLTLRGRSLYAPDLVFVNEWVKQDFLNAVLQQCIMFRTGAGRIESSKNVSQSSTLEHIAKEGYVDLVSCGGDMVVADIKSRPSTLLKHRFPDVCLVVHGVTSMDDGIDLANGLDCIAANYIFATPGTAKYIAQFVTAQMTFVNHVPLNLLYGPLVPHDTAFRPYSISPYSSHHFTWPSPQYIKDTNANIRLAEAVQVGTRRQLKALVEETAAPLPEINRPSKMVSRGFFEQGVLTGAFIVLGGATFGLCVFTYQVFRLARSL